MFYRETLAQLLRDGTVNLSDRVVVFCGGYYDAEVLGSLGFSDVTITNVDESYADKTNAMRWDRQEAETTTYSDDEFDVAIVHAGLHHCHSPHRALLEMYRVARRAVVVFEARDSVSIRLANRAGFTPDFELEAVSSEGYESGGVANGPIPNFIYRWTEREVEKTIRSFDPAHVEDIRYFYGLRIPTLRFERVNRPVRRMVLKFISPLAQVLAWIFPRQGNQFCFVILKTRKLRDWLEEIDGMIRLSRARTEQRGQAYRST
ncbi:methyltransferase domain-containing protein [Bradyrhizobium sp. 87]|uniref:class I SAM-dependent methyltransferase n=1 Tax=Bradyrhizobium sp. 87 TaxID=2782682 RepID=UPI001FF909C2|nr:methyltransferase domain-containing protein [Bradyrhizobium sp. 87]MCK1430910.1 methyltransferase domain-containing protein [Bradyrhizobium sp. 87]